MDYVTKIYIALSAFGFIYAVIIYLINSTGISEGFTALEVVVGVSAVLYGCWLIEQHTGQVMIKQVFWAFAAAGFWMALGDVGAYWLRKRNGRRLFGRISGGQDKDGDDAHPPT